MTTRTLINALWATAACVPLTLAGTAHAQGGTGGIDFLELTIGQRATGTIDQNDFKTPDGALWDIYMVELIAGENYEFTVSSNTLTPGIAVFTAEGEPIEDCLYDFDEDSFMIQVPTSGTYSVAVMSQQTGQYTLDSRSGVAEPTQRAGQDNANNNNNNNNNNNQGNNDRGNANNGQVQDINVPRDAQRIEAELNREDIVTEDGKYLSFLSMDLQAGQTFHFLIEADGFPVMLNMQDNDGNFVQINGVGLDGRYINVTAPADGNYSLLIVGLEPGRGGDYTVTAWQGDPAFAPEAGNNNGPRPNNNNNNNVGTTTIDDQLDTDDIELEDGSYFDFHYVELQAGITYHIDVMSNDFDTLAFLFDAENNQLDTNDDGPDMGTNSRIIFTPETSGEYSVGINSTKAGQTGGYRVVVAPADAVAQDGPMDVEDDVVVVDDNTDTDGPAVYVNASGSADAENNAVTDSFRLEAGQTIVIETYGLSDGCDTVAYLVKEGGEGTVVAENDDDNGLLSSRIVYTVEETGDYYVNVGVYEGSAGEFSVIVRDAYPARESIVAEGVEIAKDEYIMLGDFEFEQGPQYIVIETLDLANDCDTVIELRRTVDPERASEDDPVIATNDDFFTNQLLSRIYFQCDEPGLYYVVIHNIGKNDGSCTFRIRFEQ